MHWTPEGWVHTPECAAIISIEEAIIHHWKGRWPGYCIACEGQGEHRWFENGSPFGSGEYWSMPMSDICYECLGKGRCPRCGAFNGTSWNEDEPEPCLYCGWDNDDWLPVIDGPCLCLTERY